MCENSLLSVNHIYARGITIQLHSFIGRIKRKKFNSKVTINSGYCYFLPSMTPRTFPVSTNRILFHITLRAEGRVCSMDRIHSVDICWLIPPDPMPRCPPILSSAPVGCCFVIWNFQFRESATILVTIHGWGKWTRGLRDSAHMFQWLGSNAMLLIK